MKRILIILSILLLCPLLFFAGCGKHNDNSNKELFTKAYVEMVTGYYERQYTGQPITFSDDEVVISLPNGGTIPHEYFVFSYENNINAGQATFTITCTDDNPYLYGSVSYNFSIVVKAMSPSTVGEFNNLLNDPNFKSFSMTDFVVESGETLTIPSGITVSCYSTFRNYGNIVNNGTMDIFSSAKFFNYGSFQNNSLVTLSRTSTNFPVLYNIGDF